MKDLKPNRRTLSAIYTDLKVVINAISEFKNKNLYPIFHPEGISDEDEELLQRWEEYETFLDFSEDDYWESVFRFITDIPREIANFENYKKAQIKKYMISIVDDFRTSEIEKQLKGKVFETYLGENMIKKLLLAKSTEEIKLIKPIFIGNEKFNDLPECLCLPPLCLGDRSRTVAEFD